MRPLAERPAGHESENGVHRVAIELDPADVLSMVLACPARQRRPAQAESPGGANRDRPRGETARPLPGELD